MAAFVLAFLCLNAAGALCLSYCAGMMTVLASAEAVSVDSDLTSDHCKSVKREVAATDAEHATLAAIEPACCMMPVAMLAVPVERTVKFDTADAPLATTSIVEYTPAAVASRHSISIQQPVYRPPPLDRRIDRQLNCVIRI